MDEPILPVDKIASGPVNADNWTAIIAAAGRGSRLGFDKPKILYPLLGRSLLDWLIDALQSVCRRYVLVLSPEGTNAVEPVARARLGDALSIAVQSTPLGMADAVKAGLPFVHSPSAIVVWGDQVTLRAETVRACALVHERRSGTGLTIATCMRSDPYIDIIRDEAKRIIKVNQRREGEPTRSFGESDCGLFCFEVRALGEVLHTGLARGLATGRQTGELNLLPLLPLFEGSKGSVRTVVITDLSETLGINDRRDAALAEELLRERLRARTTP